MTEFMFNGAVRHGFGFYNPNHAAALICAVIPFLWAAWIRWRQRSIRCCIGIALTVLLMALSLTFSRTGAFVLIIELAAFCILTKYGSWKFISATVFLFITAFAFYGVFKRFTLDYAVLNRFDIWKAGMALFAANPWFGVGIGNSGDMISTFILPDRILCRTLVNSHLTLFAELGIFVGLVWLTVIFHALIKGREKPAAWTAFLGLCISAFSSSVFDWDILFDFRKFGTLPVLNFILSWITLLLFLSLAAWLSLGKKNWRIKAASFAAALIISSGMIVLYADDAPCLTEEMIVKYSRNMPLVLYDDSWDVKTVLPFLPDGYILARNSWQMRESAPKIKTESVYLFGKCSVFASSFPDARITFISPPEFVELPSNTVRVYLREYGEQRSYAFETVFY